MIELVVVAAFAWALNGLSLRANASVLQGERLKIARSPGWKGPWKLSLAFATALAVCVFMLCAFLILSAELKPNRPLRILTVAWLGVCFVVAHGFNLWVIRKLLMPNGS